TRVIAKSPQEKRVLNRLLQNIGYEVMPFKSAVSKVLADVPTEVPLTITATGGKGLGPTLSAAVELTQKGYTVAPHIPARLVAGPEELDQIVTRLAEAAVDRIFIVAGDAATPVGIVNDALDLLEALSERGHRFSNIGIGGYPEGHALLPDEKINKAIRDKAPFADRVLTQICFNSDTFLKWGSRLKGEGIDLPIFVGMPGPVSRQKLMRISAGLGLGQSANFLKKQQNMFWRFFSPAGYTPTKLIRGLIQDLAKFDTAITGFHIFTFNDLARTEAWRRDLIEQTK